MCLAAALTTSGAAIEIRSDYPAGNVKVDKIDETHAEIFKGEIPFSVPVCVRNNAVIDHIFLVKHIARHKPGGI